MLASNLFQNLHPSPPFRSFSSRRCPHRRHRLLNALPLPTNHPRRLLTTSIPLRSKPLLSTESGLNPNPNFQKSECDGGLAIDLDELADREELRFGVEFCRVRTLSPALTFAQGVERLREAVAELKQDPPQSVSGMLRFQVAVPPSAKAFSWLCCQKKSLGVFPQFYFSRKQIDKESDELNSEGGGVSGIGAAVRFYCSSWGGRSLMARYFSIDSHPIRAYGFMGINYNRESSMMEKQPGSFYSFIPQIELNEVEGCSFVASTLVWDNGLAYAFWEAVESLENCLLQVNYSSPNKMNYQDVWNHEDLGLNVNDVQLVNIDAEALSQVDPKDKCMQLEKLPTSRQFYFRHSASVSLRANLFAARHGVSYPIRECANINLVWASLIIEEFVRLGLTYFCIAPGSRSSPLALSATRHSLTTCISCFDERSLAFHALGYGRGSGKPAIVITSSGTAVSNLLPAVVEASNDFVPLILLTADRPPELLDVGANQAIDQVNHFGKLVRFFFCLPPPTDEILARMVLTTIDTAVYRATQVPFGPVHINCAFREPLADHPNEWSLKCLSGLDKWMSKTEPYTQYIKLNSLTASYNCCDDITDVLRIIQHTDKGLLLIGAIHTEDEIWAALLLAKHLSWPVVTDILSGMRMRRILSSTEIEDQFLFVDYLDHVLLSDSAKILAQPDAVVQIGSRITSKRISQFLEFCSPHAYILVDKHPCRHDPSHIVTHRIQSTITEFASVLLTVQVPRKISRWSSFLTVLNMMVEKEMTFLIRSEIALTEPHVAHIIGEAFQGEVALFLGNSMVIRDVNMYGRGWVKPRTDDIHFISNCHIQLHGIRVAANRGASGIDGLLSTAIGFSVGTGKKVICMIGDVSFLHDTNGLAMLNQRTRRKPMTILVINNHGGAIFSLLPIADRTPNSVLDQYFYTSHDVSVQKLCSAHSVKHILVQTKKELQHALWKSQKDQDDCVIEVESCIADNAKFHRKINKFTCQAADQALRVLSKIQFSEKDDDLLVCTVQEMTYSLYRIQLSAPPTSSHVKNDMKGFHREGFILAIVLDDGSVGYGEVAPTGIHKENLSNAEEQLKFLLHVMDGCEISYLLPLLKGSFSYWIWRSLGIPPHSIFPSVRCGMEMALLNAFAARHGSSLSDLLTGYSSSYQDIETDRDSSLMKTLAGIQICALVDCNGGPKDVAHIVSQLVDEGFTTIKLKVARRRGPDEDASVIQEIRQMTGYQINIRADANRKWTYEEAVQFGLLTKNCNLQYIEEPVCFEDDIIRFCEETGLPVALDETIDLLEGDIMDKLNEFLHPGIVAIVIKPSVVGGFENASLIAKWAQMHGKMAVISSAFESSLSLAAYIEFAYFLEKQNEVICKIQNREFSTAIAHGLGTYRWLKEDVTTDNLKICVPPHGSTMEGSIRDVNNILHSFKINQEVMQRTFKGEEIRSYQLIVNKEDFSHSFKLLETGNEKDNKAIVFLHGFLGTSKEWVPVMKALSATTRSISIDLPGHGQTEACWPMDKHSNQRFEMSMELVANILMKLICTATTGRIILVGYSMGARIALYMALKYPEKIDGAVIISGSPGLRDESTRRIRTAQDERRAHSLMTYGLERFLETWYAGNLWKSLRDHPHFKKMIRNRAKHNDIQGLAKSLSDLSTGRQLPLWEELKQCRKPLLFIAGEKDTKFKDLSDQMYTEIVTSHKGENNNQGDNQCEVVVVPDCGHAVHLENPLPLINAISKFIRKLE